MGESYDGIIIQSIALEHYQNKVGDMIDIQYVAFALTTDIHSSENKEVMWQDIFTIDQNTDIDDEIKVKVKKIYNKYKSQE